MAEWVYALILIVAFRRRATAVTYHTACQRPNVKAMSRFLRTSAPIGGQWTIDMLAFATFSTLVARMGEAEMAASQALLSLMHLSFMQVVGISIAISTLVGRYVGARDLVAAERSHSTGTWLGVAVSMAVGLLFLGAPNLCLRLFTSDANVLSLGAPLLVIGVAFQVCDAVGVLASGALRGAGDTRWPFLVQTALSWLVYVPIAYLLAFTLDGGLAGAWFGGVVYVAVLGGALLWRFRTGAWKNVRI
jgi:MATE family multidrug resistance protein